MFHCIVVWSSRASSLLKILSHCNSYLHNPIYPYLHWNIVIEVTASNCVIISYLTILETDECASNDTNTCDINADCTDTDSSYTCTCKDGWTGDGFTCSGKWYLMCFISKWSTVSVLIFMIYSICKSLAKTLRKDLEEICKDCIKFIIKGLSYLLIQNITSCIGYCHFSYFN